MLVGRKRSPKNFLSLNGHDATAKSTMGHRHKVHPKLVMMNILKFSWHCSETPQSANLQPFDHPNCFPSSPIAQAYLYFKTKP